MKESIKKRIEAVRRGEVPEGYRRTRAGIMPLDWQSNLAAKDIFRNHTDKKHNGEFQVLSATQDRGIIPRSEVDIDIKYAEENIGSYKKVEPGDFVISLRSFQGGIEYSEYEGLVSPAYTVLKPTRPISDNYYRAYFKTLDFISRLNGAVYGIRDGKQIGFEDFGELAVHYPPLVEQQKIAEILATCDRVIELKQQLLEEKRRQKQWLMQKLLDPNNGVRLPGFEDSEWYAVTLGEYCDCLDTLRKPVNAQQREKMQGSYPYWGANSIQGYVSDYLFDEEIVLLAEDGGCFDDFKTKPIAVYVNEKCWVNNHAHILRAKNGSTKLLYFLLVHKDIRSYINGSTRGKLTQNDMLSISITLPKNIKEQKRLIEVLTACETEIELCEQELEAWQQKKKALMQLLLTGLVRV